MSFKPNQLHLYIGGFPGPSYSLEMREGGMIYTAQNCDAEDITTTITPTDADWQAFIKTLDRLDVWSWKKRYLNLDLR